MWIKWGKSPQSSATYWLLCLKNTKLKVLNSWVMGPGRVLGITLSASCIGFIILSASISSGLIVCADCWREFDHDCETVTFTSFTVKLLSSKSVKGSVHPNIKMLSLSIHFHVPVTFSWTTEIDGDLFKSYMYVYPKLIWKYLIYKPYWGRDEGLCQIHPIFDEIFD